MSVRVSSRQKGTVDMGMFHQLAYPAVYSVDYELYGKTSAGDVKLMIPLPAWIEERRFFEGLVRIRFGNAARLISFSFKRRIH